MNRGNSAGRAGAAAPSCRRALAAAALLSCFTASPGADTFRSSRQNFVVETVVEGLTHPWGMAFLPDGSLLVTERHGALRVIRDGRLLEGSVAGLPEMREHGQGGLMGIALHPEFAKNRLLYLAYAAAGEGGYGTEVIRGTFAQGRLENVQTLFRAEPKTTGGRHFGCRLVFDRAGYLFISLGERGDQEFAQQLADHRGKLVRLHDDGRVPADNPFAGQAGAKPEIFTWGNRNMQGMALHPATGEIWTHEHGPQGGDEVNVMRPGVNYGWPVITYGVNYGLGTKIGEGTHKEGMAQPLYKWVPSIAPSGMAFYTGDRFPQWQGNLFVGSLKFGLLVRLELDGERVVAEERLLDGRYGRIRDVVQGPDGLLYLLTDEPAGKLLRLVPVE
jgi:glucose/arabinose dehydrogenase